MKIFSKKLLSRTALAVAITALLLISTSCGKHEHTFSNEWSTDEESHWYAATCKHSEEKSELGEHEYDNDCDTNCNVCEYERTAKAHVYDNDCDAECNTCGAKRDAAHKYDNDCDANCNVCEAVRTISHSYGESLTVGEETHYYLCSVCGAKKDEASHVFDKAVAHSDYLKTAATATTKAQYFKSCACGAKSNTEYFESDKIAATLTSIQDLSKTYDKVELGNPTYETNSDGAVTIEWYQGDTKLDAKPVNAGTYKVKVNIPETATYTGISAEKEFTIAKKTLNYLELTKVYDGEGVLAYALGTEHGVVAGDTVLFYCDEAPDYIVGTYNLIPDEDPTTIDDSGADDRAFLAGADKANYKFAERIEGKYKLCATITVTKRVIWTTGAEFPYGRCTTFSGEERENNTDIEIHNLADGETMDSSFISWIFNGTNADSTLSSVEFIDEDDGRSNYTIDITKCSANIVARKLKFPSTIEKGYDGTDVFKVLFNGDNGAVANENVIATIKIESSRPCENPADGFEYFNVVDAGTYTHDNSSIGQISFKYAGATDETSNYDFDDDFYNTTVEFTATINKIGINLPLNITVDYSGSTEFTTMLDGISLENGEQEKVIVKFTAKTSSGVVIEDAGTYPHFKDLTVTYINPNYEYNNDYDPGYSRTLTVNKKTLSNLTIQITDEVFEGNQAYLNTDNGVFHEDKVYIVWTESGHNNTMMWKEHGSDLIAPYEGTPIQGKAQITLGGSDASNYELVLENGSYGRMEYSPFCKPDAHGVCACGEIHDGTGFDQALIISCKEAYNQTFNLSVGDSVYFKIMGEEGEMNNLIFKAKDGSTAKFTAKYYSLSNTSTPSHTELDTTETYMDVNYTSNQYLIITCTSAGEFTLTVEK